MPSLRDALSTAFDNAETGTLETPREIPIDTSAPDASTASTQDPAGGETAQQREDRLRDERGRFAKAEQVADDNQATQTAQPTAPPVAADATNVAAPATPPVETRKPPSSWSKDQWERWNKLDPETQSYIEKREADYAKGVSTYKGQWDQAQPIYEAMQPFMPELQQYGIQPAQWIQNLGTAHRTLALGSPEQKLQMFAKLATDYGVPLQALNQAAPGPDGQPAQQPQIDPQFGYIAQTVSSLQNRLQQFETFQQQQEQQRIQSEIDRFKADKPHFDAVKETMGQLLQSGVAPDLQTAYEKAIRLHDDIWTQRQNEERAKQAEALREEQRKAEEKRLAEIAQKKAAAVSPRSSSPTGNTTAGGGKKDRRSVLAEAWDDQDAGRF